MSVNLNTFEKVIIPQSTIINSDGVGERYEWQPVGKYNSEARELGTMAVSKDPETGEKFLYINGGMYVQGYGWKTSNTYNTTYSNNVCQNIIYNIDTNTFSNYSPANSTRRFGGAGGYWNGGFYYMCGIYAGGGSSTSYPYRAYPYALNNIFKCELNATEVAVTPNVVPTNFYQPAYCQKDNLLYIFGGAPFVSNFSAVDSGSSALHANVMAVMDSDNRKSYIFDMENQTLTSLPDLPITGGRFVSACISGNYIYIRNLEKFCRLNISTNEYETLPSFQTVTDTYVKPEIINFNDNGTDIIISTSGSLTDEYAECYNILTNEITKWDYPAFPTQRFKLFNIDNELYQICGSLTTEDYHGLSVCKMVKKESTIKAERPVVAKIPAGAYYHGLQQLEIPELGLSIKTTPQLADKDYYIAKGMYSYPSEYTLYLESK